MQRKRMNQEKETSAWFCAGYNKPPFKQKLTSICQNLLKANPNKLFLPF